MFLFINTANINFIYLAILDKNGKFLVKKKIETVCNQAEKLLLALEKIINGEENKLKGIIVVIGPGSFTALRLGVAVANTLAFALQVPVVGVKDQEWTAAINEGLRILSSFKHDGGKYTLPEYGREPTITKSNK